MYQFTVHQEGIKNARRRVIVPLIIVCAILLTIMITIAWPDSQEDQTISNIETLRPYRAILLHRTVGLKEKQGVKFYNICFG